MDCYDLVDEKMLVDISLHDMAEEYRVFLENLSLSFSRLKRQPDALMNQPVGLQSLTQASGSSSPTNAKEEADICGAQQCQRCHAILLEEANI